MAPSFLIVSAMGVAFFHALAPDHWLPFSALARSSGWSLRRLVGITFLAGAGHVASSLMLGFLGLWLGWTVSRLEGMEAWRGNAGLLLLIGFGVAYGLWGLKHAQHHHPHITLQETVKKYAKRWTWILFVVMVFGPCEPLIPLMFLAWKEGAGAVTVVSLIFSIVTIAMIMAQSCMAYLGLRLFRAAWMERYAHALAGFTIVLTVIFVWLVGV